MAAISPKTEQVFSRDTADATTLLLPTLATVQGTDANGYPYLTVGDITTGNGGAYISFVPEVTLQSDALGNAQRVYGPHRIRLAVEMSSTTNVAIMTSVVMAVLLQILLKWGTKLELWMSPNSTGPSDTTFSTAANLVQVIYPDAYNPLRSQQ